MGRHKNPKPNIHPQKNIFSEILLTILLVLITIGDGVRFFGWFIVLVSKITYSLITSTANSFARSVRKRFKHLQTIRIPFLRVPQIQIKKPTITLHYLRLPRIVFPSIRLPKIHVPSIKFPHLPTFSLPHFFSFLKKETIF